jgi:hypothetical protein
MHGEHICIHCDKTGRDPIPFSELFTIMEAKFIYHMKREALMSEIKKLKDDIGRIMSGPRPRFKSLGLTSTHFQHNGLCYHCDLSPGWGWEAESEYKWAHKPWEAPDDAPLPPPGNGWLAKGLCPYCAGTGIMPIPHTEFFDA